MLHPRRIGLSALAHLALVAFLAGLPGLATEQSLAAPSGEDLSAVDLPTLYRLNFNGGGCGDNGHGNEPDGFDGSNPGRKPGTLAGAMEDGTPGFSQDRWQTQDNRGNCGVSPN